MKLLLDVSDDKAPHLMKILKDLSFVKAKTITPGKARLLLDVKNAVKEMKLIKSGKKKARNAEAFLDEL